MSRARNDPAYIAIVAVSCFLILVVGALTRPSDEQAESPPARVAELLDLERLSQRIDVERVADYFSYVALQVEESVVLLGATGHSGVVWQGGEVVTSARLGPFPARDRTALGSREVDLKTVRSAPHLPYVLLEAPLDAAVSDRRQVRLYESGSWLVAVWRSRSGGLRFAPGNLFGVMDGGCGEVHLTEVQTNFDLSSMQPGAGVFSLDGGLVAVVLDCAGSRIVAEVGALESRARAGLTFQDRVAERFGMRPEQATEPELRFFGRNSGVLVKETWWGYRAREAGLAPGDLIVGLDGTPVESLTDLQSLLLPVSREVRELAVWRAGRRRTVRMMARSAKEAAVSTRGFVVHRDGMAVDSAIRGTLADRVGARPGDTVLSVNQRATRSLEDLEAALREAEGMPVYVVMERHGRAWGTLVQPDE